MNQHMQQNMPQHLKKYVGENAAYVPRHMEAQVAKQMQKNMPAHLKQYAGAYMQQNVVQHNTERLHNNYQTPREVTPHAPLPDKLRRGHSQPYGEQHTVELNTLPNDQSMFQPDQPQQPAPQQPQSDYEFFLNPEQPAKQSRLPGGNSTATRALLFGGLLVVLMIVFAVAKSLLGGSANLTGFVSVAQDQQSMLHILQSAGQQQDLSTDNKNFAATAEISLDSAQSDLIGYLKINHQKVSVKQLNLKISSSVDTQLAAAASGSTYNQTFKEVMQTQLNSYVVHLQQTYQQTSGPKGRALLNSDYAQAKLLLNQLVTVPN
jgi:hypothetical protein